MNATKAAEDYNIAGQSRQCIIAKVIHSSKLKGMRGDNGEEYCLFIRDCKNPLNSGWKWFHTEDEAHEGMKLIKIEPDTE